MTDELTYAKFAPVIIKLLQGVLYNDDNSGWELFLTHRLAIETYFAQIGIKVDYSYESQGFVFLRQPEPPDDGLQRVLLPRLARRDRLTYGVTLICVLLRERLIVFEREQIEDDRLIITQHELVDLVISFYKERNDIQIVERKIVSDINRVVELGFLRRLPQSDETRFEVLPIIKARIDYEKLLEIKERLSAYVTLDV